MLMPANGMLTPDSYKVKILSCVVACEAISALLYCDNTWFMLSKKLIWKFQICKAWRGSDSWSGESELWVVDLQLHLAGLKEEPQWYVVVDYISWGSWFGGSGLNGSTLWDAKEVEYSTAMILIAILRTSMMVSSMIMSHLAFWDKLSQNAIWGM